MTRVWEAASAVLTPIWAAAAWKAAIVSSAWWALLAVPLTALAALLVIGFALTIREPRT